MLYVILSFLTAFSLFAQSDIDTKLQGYIENFQLKTLAKPANVNKKLANVGHELFETTLISGNKNISCRDCHHPRAMTMDGLPLGLGEGSKGIQAAGQTRNQGTGKILARNTPGLFNLNGMNVMFWDGRVSYNPLTKEFSTPVPLKSDVANTLSSAVAAQAIFPMVDHSEMRGEKGTNEIADAVDEYAAWDAIVARVMADPELKGLLEEVFPGEQINIGHLGNAIAEFQRSAFFYADTPYDNYIKGDLKALNEIQKLGMDVFFGKGKCGECHKGEQLSTFEYHNIGIPQIGPGKQNGDDFGRYQWDKSEGNMYAFKVPALRNVALTAPYMHDGTFKTLAQVVEHYDMIVESFTEFKLINNWKSYIEKLADHNHDTDALRQSTLSPKISKRLFFEEEEEKALTEFLTSALTDKKLASMEVDGDYETYFRMQLRPAGFEKLNAAFNGARDNETFYYFDTLLEGGYYLREAIQPIRLILIKRNNGTELVYREMVHKTAVADSGVVLGGQFNRNEYKMVPEDTFANIENAYVDMFNRIYTYNDGTRADEIPAIELSVIKSDVDAMNDYFHQIDFKGADRISDVMNQPKEDVFYVPTSYNTKETNTFTITVEGRPVKCILQKSVLRTETGALETTWAIEFETTKILKADTERFGKALLKQLGLEASEVGGGTPSPSVLTLKVLELLGLNR